MASEGRDQGVKIVVGTRRGPQRELLEALGAGRFEIDLDADEYFDREDVARYVHARLLAADSRAPYGDDPALTEEVAQAVAHRADRSFLVAVIVSASLAAADEVPDLGRQHFPSELGDALDDYLAHLPDERRVRDLLTALAFAEGNGFPFDAGHALWSRVATQISGFSYEPEDVEELLRSRAVDLIERHPDTTPTYRLFHHELRDHLRGRAPVRLEVSERQIQQRFVDALEATVPATEQGGARDWSKADRYVLTHLATHAAAAGYLDPFLNDPDYLVEADPPRLIRALPAATEAASAAKRTYQLWVARS